MDAFIKKFEEITIKDISLVGGKNASLGEMYNQLSPRGVRVPNGFATTSYAFWLFLKENDLDESLKNLLKKLDRKDFSNLNEIGLVARKLILEGIFSDAFSGAIMSSYKDLCEDNIAVAVRSSATAEDLPEASFAGQHDTFLNIKGEKALLKEIKQCFASLYTDRAIKYREDKGFLHHEIALSVGVQKMVRSDMGCSGVGFTIEPESGFKDIIHLSGVWGLGENIVQGTINPDEFYVFKPTLQQGKNAIVQKKLGDKEKTMVYSESNRHSSTMNIDTKVSKQQQFVLSDNEIITLAQWALVIEEHYKKPMDIEWAKDGITNELFITQARPETVHHSKKTTVLIEYKLEEKSEVLTVGNAIGSKITTGIARILKSPKESNKLQEGDIIITDVTSPDWDPLLKKAGAIVTNRGGRTSHAAIVARELGVPAVVGTNSATQGIKEGQAITVSCAEGKTGYVYKGALSYKEEEIDFSKIQLPDTEAKLILSDPEKAFQYSFYPNDGIGLLRMEFIITHMIKVHPMALVKFSQIKNVDVKKNIESLTKNYSTKEDYFIDQLSQGIATMAAAFYPKEVIVRMSDFKTNEYANLIGGKQFEPKEENPMLGFRGASRYYNDRYREGFQLECKAIRRIREEMGLTNVKVMIPFCRTIEEGKKVIHIMEEYGLKQGDNGLEVYVMSEIPSNVILAEEFAEIFDGFSIGSNDLTQLTLGVDRDSELMASIFDERDPATKKMIAMAIEKANNSGKKIGLCGQAPSDFSEYASFLVKAGIDSISFNPDALLKGIENINKAESYIAAISD
ncbi:phosphoenolpyruvate synthase [Aquimarina sp. MAR_2010_214]|uniref:phosphoenolpyruvate synthase n=1 Tax=Aquimarina sp. MAR_2010_214 TaxID=1250026 RepID=UPI000C706593|nr:phosphoenolpyruvate synthase [Aquimarina sp. MAR_2010_214]PKV50618.1 phosphoenolpyruvate synthase [Aquimarina sp. MAR_2010_214]